MSENIRALNAQYVSVEGRFDATQKGHESSFVGAVVEVTNLKRQEESSQP